MAYTTEQIEEIKNKILNALEEVIDPELGIDIVNLGLVYEIHFDGETGATIIDMTLTTMGCPLADLLTDREENVLRLRFGLDDGKMRTLEDVGKVFNVTRERIRQIEAKALRKLRHPSRSKPLRDFIED